MGFGIRMRTLWRLRRGVAASAMLALAVAVWSLFKVSVLPPALTARSLEMATATTQAVIDTPRSALLDRRQDTYALQGLTNRAVLLGNVIANGPVRRSIARRVGVPAETLRIEAPVTQVQPRPLSDKKNENHPGDILKSTDQYRLSIRANPTVPVLDIYSQTPTAESAARLANAAVDALRSYLTSVAASERIPPGSQIRILQLGRARGAVINNGVDVQVGLLAFFLSFGISVAAVVFLSRVREGWRLAAALERTAAD